MTRIAEMTGCRIRRWKTRYYQFELHQEQNGNSRESWLVIRGIGPRGGLTEPFTPNWAEALGDYDKARELLVRRAFKYSDEMGPVVRALR